MPGQMMDKLQVAGVNRDLDFGAKDSLCLVAIAEITHYHTFHSLDGEVVEDSQYCEKIDLQNFSIRYYTVYLPNHSTFALRPFEKRFDLQFQFHPIDRMEDQSKNWWKSEDQQGLLELFDEVHDPNMDFRSWNEDSDLRESEEQLIHLQVKHKILQGLPVVLRDLSGCFNCCFEAS